MLPSRMDEEEASEHVEMEMERRDEMRAGERWRWRRLTCCALWTRRVSG